VRVAQAASLVLFALVAAGIPLGLRAVNAATGMAHLSESYLPAVMPPRGRGPFHAEAVTGFRATEPTYVVIGDSMAGSRINHRRLMELAGAPVVPIYESASGSAFWYLAFKNWVVASGIHPKAVIFFFRDENLTDPMFRLTPRALDRVARDREPELNDILAAHAQGPYFRVHATARGLYQFDRTRAWVEPLVAAAPVPLAAGPLWRPRLLTRINGEIFTLANLRPMAAADMAFGDRDKFDFRKHLPVSVLPAIIRVAKQAGIRPAFVRVQRRPVNDRPPGQSEALQEYVRQLREYLQANGAYFHDEWGDPELPLAIYSDGDHIGRPYLTHCTDLFYRRNPGLFR
jgi:hypothetical protein